MRVTKCCGDFHVEIEKVDLIDWTCEKLEHKVFSSHLAAVAWRDIYMSDHGPGFPAPASATMTIKSYLWYENPEDAE